VSIAALGAVAAALAAQPPAEPVVEPTAKAPIVVAGKPISRGWLRHWADVAGRSSGGAVPRSQLRSQAANLLISARWIRGEAEEQGVKVTPGEVTRSFRKQRRQSFPRRREFRRFLRDSGQTVGNIRLRIRLDLLAGKLRDLVTAGAATPDEEQERLDAFVREFRRKWRARTACRAPWVSESDCGIQPTRSR
jgi:SurA N-terminal domain